MYNFLNITNYSIIIRYRAQILIKLARETNNYGWMNTSLASRLCLLWLVSGKSEYRLVTVSFPWLDSPDWRCRSTAMRNSARPNTRAKCTHGCIRLWEIVVFKTKTLSPWRIKNSDKRWNNDRSRELLQVLVALSRRSCTRNNKMTTIFPYQKYAGRTTGNNCKYLVIA